MIELLMSKQRILELYLNVIEFGQGIFGVQSAAQHYFGIDAKQLNADQASHLIALLPNPRVYGKNIHSQYINMRSRKIRARLRSSQLPTP